MDLAAIGHCEPEFCVQILSGDVTNGQTLQLRVSDAGTAIAAYTDTPTITVSESSPVVVTPGTAVLTTTSFVPTVTTPRTVTPGTVALTTSLFAPTVTVGVSVIPGTIALTLTQYVPTVTVSNNQTVTPGIVELILASFSPTVSVSDSSSHVNYLLNIASQALYIASPREALPRHQ